MNKILKAAHSHYLAQKDFFLSELDIVINRSNQQGDTQKAIELIKEISLTVSCINNIEAIISDNKSNMDLNSVNSLAELIEERLKKDQNKNIDENA
jgi:alpha-galactosidase